jgi:hypothetical protein
MMVVFEVFLAPGADADALLPPATKQETGAVVMTIAEAEAVGFGGVPADPSGRDRRLVAVRKADAQWVHRALEGSEACGGFRMFDVD